MNKTFKWLCRPQAVMCIACLFPFTTAFALPEKNTAASEVQESAQQNPEKRTVTGTVTDATDGTPIIGANIKIKNSDTGVITDLDGKFSLQVTSKDILVVSYIGYKTVEAEVSDLAIINIKLSSADELLDEVVVVGAGTQKKVSVTGAITSIKGEQLKLPTSSLTTSFAGRLAGVIAQTNTGQPGQAAEFYIRGVSTFGGRTTPLIMLDDVEISAGDLNNIPPETIESFSVLKDASATAIYGARGANGVMIIKTKSGKENTRTSVNVTVENSFNVLNNFPEFADGATWMEMYNEAIKTRSTTGAYTPKYSQEQIENTRLHVNPYMYPDVDWTDVMFKKMAMMQRANINIQGGGSKVSYYMSINANHDTGLLNTEKAYSFDNNLNYWAYNFQNNINYKLTNTTRIELRMNAQIRNQQGPNFNKIHDLFVKAINANPVAFPVRFPAQEGDKHIRFGNAYLSGSTPRTNPYADMMTTYKQFKENTVNTSLKVSQDLGFITKGLSATALVNFKNWSSDSYTRSIAPYYYRIADGTFDPATGAYELERVGTSGTDYISESDITKGSDNTFLFQFTLDYARRFGKHNVGGMLLYLQREYKNAVLPQRNQGLSGRFTYDYDQRYLAEVNFGYNGTERLAKGDRFELFPAISLGWMVSNEAFFEPLRDVVTSFKLRGSYGLVGSDETGLLAGAPHFLYIDQVAIAGGSTYFTGENINSITQYTGPNVSQYAVQNGGWERVKKLDIGTDILLFDALGITFDFFYDKRYNILLHREAWPESLGYYGAKPWSNVGKVNNWGYELSLNYQKRINNDLAFDFRGNFTYTENKYIDVDEPAYPYVWQTSTDKPIYRQTGYICEGFFRSDEEIANSADQTSLGSTPMVGDLKYRDVNGDGIISSDDKVMISPYGQLPRIQYGFGLNVDYKNWNFGVFFNGSAKRTIMINDNITPFGQNDSNLLKFIADNHWSEENQNWNAKYPRLGATSAQVANNTQSSDYWLRNGSFLRFKTLEVGYRFKKYARVFFTGDNLFVFAPFKEWDPELEHWYSYPMQRVFNLGVQLTF